MYTVCGICYTDNVKEPRKSLTRGRRKMPKSAITVWLEEPIIKRDGDFFIAHSEEMQLVGCGLTSEDAKKDLGDAITTSMKALLKNGKLFETLDKLEIRYDELETHLSRTKSNRSLEPLLLGV